MPHEECVLFLQSYYSIDLYSSFINDNSYSLQQVTLDSLYSYSFGLTTVLPSFYVIYQLLFSPSFSLL
jgi:hypothetical protein